MFSKELLAESLTFLRTKPASGLLSLLWVSLLEHFYGNTANINKDTSFN